MNAPDTVALDAVDVSKHVTGPAGRIDILDSVTLRVAYGESLAIVGASGSGKTTLLGLLAGLDTPSSGRIHMDGHPLHDGDEETRAALRRQLVGFVFQSFHLMPALSAEENVMLPLELDGATEARSRAREALDAVGLTPRRGHFPHQLSGGEQQRVALARAFVNQPRILFADEPTGNLDRHTGSDVCDLLFQLNHAHATTLVMVTHDVSLAERCMHVAELDEGRLREPA
ncbi:ATP-binding cassette domain-containing protein [Oleiagrimonas sp.]|jgi:putative ABC transport system ATP-binding protein|uniref:ABC transporter ATP-binding protein n=1 Tax=Oleiagrimonas sp. TaxID=2010330 RepID=UPI002629EF17|nr:ATP-binding cassette domain-containing protein [Oleiagrimonas sp.]MDA3914670.1 ATP-binding cassette domain-containing protein [Oleiagrimonas sp.]